MIKFPFITVAPKTHSQIDVEFYIFTFFHFVPQAFLALLDFAASPLKNNLRV